MAPPGVNFGELERERKNLLPLPVAEFNNGKSKGSRSIGKNIRVDLRLNSLIYILLSICSRGSLWLSVQMSRLETRDERER